MQQVVDGGHSVPAVARSLERSLERSAKTLANSVGRARRDEAPTAVSARGPMSEVDAALARLPQEVAKLRMAKEILKKAASFTKESR